jgi:hypothetical protein
LYLYYHLSPFAFHDLSLLCTLNNWYFLRNHHSFLMQFQTFNSCN